MTDMDKAVCFQYEVPDSTNEESRSGTRWRNTSEKENSSDDDELLDDADIKLILETIKYRVKWLTKYIDRHDQFGGAEGAKVKRRQLNSLSYKIRHADD